jgi:putative alpha-1,2-mannosidase
MYRIVVVSAAVVAAAVVAVPSAAATAQDLTSLVNPFVGTQNDGNTFPGASMPFGMVQESPDNGGATGYTSTSTT